MKKVILLFLLLVIVPETHAKKVIDGVERTVVFVGMVGDMFHVGHVNILKRARAFGDYLLVGLTKDEDAVRYKRVPILTYEERKAVVESCRYVDEVVPEPYQMTREFMDEHGVDWVVHGNDMDDIMLRFFYQVAIDMGKLKVLSYTPGISTSNIIQRILERADEFRSLKKS
jgi:glycerol-3-phosphate cytidylyltransferase